VATIVEKVGAIGGAATMSLYHVILTHPKVTTADQAKAGPG
jgi:hypothetical protein